MINRSELLKDLQRELPKIEKDILAYSESREDLTAHLQEEYKKAKDAGRTAEHFVSWLEAQVTQAAVSWVLTCVFVRFLEDNGLLAEPVLSGPVSNLHGEKPLQYAKERMVAYFNENPTHEEREYLFSLFEQIEQFPVIAELLDHRHNPLWQIPVSADGAKSLIDFFQKIDAESGEIVHDFNDSDWDTRFLGDLYQDLSESVRKRYALLQTPEFVESFILDYTLDKAKDTFGLKGLRLIDPTCGSGHFLLTTFERVFDDWVKREPGENSRVLAQRALDVVHGVDINPYAIAICRFRLLIAAMKVAGTTKIINAPNFHFNLACGDSLLHGNRFEWQGQGLQAELIDEDPINHALEVEDKDKLLKILGQQYHAVVGNPPYIVVKDKALNQAYRDRYSTCHRQYSLGVPFTERFFDLTIPAADGCKSGYMGMITANSFMKREFGTKLVQEYLVRKDVTHVIDTSGAYIPGHGTPTVIIFARNRRANNAVPIRSLLGNRAEPSTPHLAENGRVWSSIISLLEHPGKENEFISVEDRPREIYSTHPWSLSGGGASAVKQMLEGESHCTLGELVSDVGYLAVTGEDSVFMQSHFVLERKGIRCWKKMAYGEVVRDWGVDFNTACIWPNDDSGVPIDLGVLTGVLNFMWPFKVPLRNRKAFGVPVEKKGIPWWQLREIYGQRLGRRNLIFFAEIASHNHFSLVEGGTLTNQTAPIVALSSSADKNDYLELVGYLNSSVVGFYMKQVSHQKQLTGGDGVRIEFISKVPYQFSSTAIKKIPIPPVYGNINFKERMLKLSAAIDQIQSEIDREDGISSINESFKVGVSIDVLWKEKQRLKRDLRKKQVLLQEEIDWVCYWGFGLCDESFLSDVERWLGVGLSVGQRPFEIQSQLNQDGFLVSSDVPSLWPEEMKNLWRRRINAIEDIREIGVIENPHYKRRWIGRQGLFNKSSRSDELKLACKQWMLTRIENQYLKTFNRLITCASLADRIRKDEEFIEIASYYTDNDMFDIQKLICELVRDDNIPQMAAARLKPKALPKFRAWLETWGRQRQEDAIDVEFGVEQPLSEQDAEDSEKLAAFERAKLQATEKKAQDVGDIPVPPKYASSDFRKASYWPLRGKLDVPKERFFSLPGCEKDGDATLVIGWAGMNHLQRAQSIAAWYLDRKEGEGWEAEKLMPMLVALDELIPWLKQWHNDVDPEFGERMGDYYDAFLMEELRMLNVSRDELLSWEPPVAPKKKRATKKKKSAVAE